MIAWCGCCPLRRGYSLLKLLVAVSKRVATKYVTDVGSRDRDEKYSTACFHNSLEMRPLLYRRREII